MARSGSIYGHNSRAGTGIVKLEARDTAKYPKMHRTVFDNKELCSPKGLRWRDSGLGQLVLWRRVSDKPLTTLATHDRWASWFHKGHLGRTSEQYLLWSLLDI